MRDQEIKRSRDQEIKRRREEEMERRREEEKKRRRTNESPALCSVIGVFDDKDKSVENGGDEEDDEDEEINPSEKRIGINIGKRVEDGENAVSIQKSEQSDACPREGRKLLADVLINNSDRQTKREEERRREGRGGGEDRKWTSMEY